MKFDSILRSNHDLKKNGYKIIRKLHKMENMKGANLAYSSSYADTYFFVLSCRTLASIIEQEYPEAQTFCNRCDSFVKYLDKRATLKGRLEKPVLAGFLHAYTVFFNRIIREKHKFVFDQAIRDMWNLKCLMAYIAAWGENH